jgi:hypothetical protein
MCKFPNCKRKAIIDFSFIPVCKSHFVELYEETFLYYNKGTHVRPKFDQIKHFREEKIREARMDMQREDTKRRDRS